MKDKDMNSIKIQTRCKTNEIGYQPVTGTSSYSVYLLGMFLSTEMRGGGFDFFYKWMKASDWNETGGNLMFLKKSGNNVIIYFDDDHEKYEQDPENNSLNIPLEELIKLADKWRELIKTEPLFIIITEENNKYTMEAAQE